MKQCFFVGEIAAKMDYDLAFNCAYCREGIKDMTMKLRLKSKTIRRIFVTIIMVILIMSLATPASAKAIGRNSKTIDGCDVNCTKYIKSTDNTYSNSRIVPVYSFTVGGVKKTLYVEYTQNCENGHYGRVCTPMARCSVNHLCEQIGPPQNETKGYWETCSKWTITRVWVALDTTAGNPSISLAAENGSETPTYIPENGHIYATQTIFVNTTISTKLSSFLFVLNWLNATSNLEATLTTPSGVKIDSTTKSPIIYGANKSQIFYILPNPEVGKWTATITAKNVQDIGESYWALFSTTPEDEYTIDLNDLES